MSQSPTSSEEFELPAAARALLPEFHASARALTETIITAMRATGLPPLEAASVAASVLLAEAWIGAAEGKRRAGGAPDPERFYAVARDAVSRIEAVVLEGSLVSEELAE